MNANRFADSTPATWLQLSDPLVRVTAISGGLLLLMLLGLLLDERTISGAPAWLKPAKFAASTGVYTLTFAWMLRDVPRPRPLAVATSLIAWISLLETLLVSVQAARGTTSHFNIDSPFNIAVYSTMGTGIFIVWVLSAMVLWYHARTPTHDRALAIAFRLGLALNILGAGTGWLMTQPRPEQLAAIDRGERPRVAGMHTVGAKDGDEGIPLLRWSGTHGDLRAPHFLGMHAFQLLPLLLLGVRRVRARTAVSQEVALVGITAGICFAIFIGALVQALAGVPLLPYPRG